MKTMESLKIICWVDNKIELEEKGSSQLLRISIEDEKDFARTFIGKSDALQIINHLKEQFGI